MQGLEDLGEADGVKIYNPAFDVTPAKNITAIITERGVIKKPSAQKIVKHFKREKDS
jgi:methylthioribose-1-phosphate isomerase